MKDQIFDEFLASLLNDKSSGKAQKSEEESSETSDVKEYNPSAPTDVSDVNVDDIKEFAEKTIQMSNGEATKFFTVSHSEPNLEPQQPQRVRRHKKRVIKANYSAYGGIVLATLVLCCSLIISLAVIVVGRDFLGIDMDNNEFTLYIEDGWTTEQIAECLYDNGIIQYPEVFTGFARLKKAVFYPGDIDVKPSMSYSDIIDSLSEVRSAHATVTVTLVEGITLDDAAKTLEENVVCNADEFIYAFNTNIYGYGFETYVSSSSLKFYKYEGYLFPDTYEFYVGDSVYNIVKKIKQRTDEILNDSVIQRCSELGYSLDQIVTLASMVQLEAGQPDDMKNVASVFYNRLNNPSEFPRLQSDTTFKYIENVIKSNANIAYQEMYDAYDSYVCNGIPVGAICNPGLDAINAVLYPNETDYYYFCANVDTREIYYAQTYDEHMENCELAGIEV